MDNAAAVPETADRAKREDTTLELAPILVAVNFSPESEAALLWACAYAERIDATIEVMHVVHDPTEMPGKYESDDSNPIEPKTEAAERMVLEFLADVRSRHPNTRGLEMARIICIKGLPSAVIVYLAYKLGAQHLVLGSRGGNGSAGALLASTSEQVVRHALLPVTVVKAMREKELS